MKLFCSYNFSFSYSAHLSCYSSASTQIKHKQAHMPVFLWLGFLGCQGREGLDNLPPLLHGKTIGGYTWNAFLSPFFFVSGNAATLLNVMCNVGSDLNDDTNSLYLHMWQNQSEAGKQWFPWKIQKHHKKHGSPVFEGLVFSWSSCQWQCWVGPPSPSFQSVEKTKTLELEKNAPGNTNFKKK